ncbi:MAG: DNA topoisomerase (ATP-hydrolyzing) subunit B [Oscillospiraceae bacterium]|jgi:DNA gyrase subunit B|nr:DNA topoisomerase (ATP-hydrolyzing) subunit B [Oscillospiraceae bacterium]
MQNNEEYTASQIQVLEGLEAVRKRPGMYIGTTSARGLHHLVYEIVDNAIDEALAGRCSKIKVVIEADNIIRVSDDGHGIPVGIQEQTGKSALEVVFTVLHAGGKFGGGGYKVSGGLHGVGASVVNALSEWLQVEVCIEDDGVYMMDFTRGDVVTPITKIDAAKLSNLSSHGTTVRFKPDAEIFDEIIFEYETLHARMREQAFLNAGLEISIFDERPGNEQSDTMKYEGGIRTFVEYINKNRTVLHDDVLYFSERREDREAEVAMQWTDKYNETFVSFANNIHTTEGGMHETGFRAALTRTLNDYATKNGFLKGEEKFAGEDAREGLSAIVSVRLTEAQFEGQTKTKLGNADIRTLVENMLNKKLSDYLEENPRVAKIIIDKAMQASRAREAAKKARDLSRKKSISEGSTLPGKLTDCYGKEAQFNEIFIVEGDSAGGSAISGRDSRFQAILPLWGKMLNVEKARADKVYGNDKLSPVILALGAGIGDEFDASRLRYHKIVIMADADVDGAHICTLLLTFFYRFMKPLIEGGYVYIAQPPLYKVVRGKEIRYALDDAERERITAELKGGNENAKIELSRNKGLGEMDASELWETTMNPESRVLLKVELEDAVAADEIFTVLMGEKVEPRREFIEINAKYVENLDI